MIGGNTGLPVESVGNMRVLWSKMSETRRKKKKKEREKTTNVRNQMNPAGRGIGHAVITYGSQKAGP